MPSTVPILNKQGALAAEYVYGNRQAFGKLYAGYAPMLLGFIMRSVPDKKLAEEILQQSFLVAWESRHAIGAQPIISWLLGITRAGIQATGNNAPLPAIQQDISYVHISGTSGINAAEGLEKTVFDFVYFKGFSMEEVAEELNIEEVNLKMILRSAVTNLKTRGHE